MARRPELGENVEIEAVGANGPTTQDGKQLALNAIAAVIATIDAELGKLPLVPSPSLNIVRNNFAFMRNKLEHNAEQIPTLEG